MKDSELEAAAGVGVVHVTARGALPARGEQSFVTTVTPD